MGRNGITWVCVGLHAGGFAIVQKVDWLNPTTNVAEVVAVKKLKPEALSGADDLKEFLLEANLMRKMHHPCGTPVLTPLHACAHPLACMCSPHPLACVCSPLHACAHASPLHVCAHAFACMCSPLHALPCVCSPLHVCAHPYMHVLALASSCMLVSTLACL
jgi:hypothetical protein